MLEIYLVSPRSVFIRQLKARFCCTGARAGHRGALKSYSILRRALLCTATGCHRYMDATKNVGCFIKC